jgi:hypothetical protein
VKGHITRDIDCLPLVTRRLIPRLCYTVVGMIYTWQPEHDMSSSRRYITNEQGERVGVLLDLAEYQQLTRSSAPDPDLLSGLSEAELQALAQSVLAPAEQSRLDDLLARNADAQLSETEQTELDRLLHHVDQLTILKTRARYTLAQHTGLMQTS